jgi:hypothetical protein
MDNQKQSLRARAQGQVRDLFWEYDPVFKVGSKIEFTEVVWSGKSIVGVRTLTANIIKVLDKSIRIQILMIEGIDYKYSTLKIGDIVLRNQQKVLERCAVYIM